MEIVKVIIYEYGKEKYKLYFRKDSDFKVFEFCKRNKFYEFTIYDGDSRNDYSIPRDIVHSTKYLVDFYREAGDNPSLDSVYTFGFNSSNPLDYEDFCSDNYFYKFQIRNANEKSPFYYCGKLVSKKYDGFIKRLSANCPEITKFLIFGNFLHIGLTKRDITLEDIKRQKERKEIKKMKRRYKS